jgi:3-dehydroquinate synthase
VGYAEEFGFRRRDVFVAIGGGTIMDITGVAAGIYKRAASYVRVPLTLTGMVNSARLTGRARVNYIDSKGVKHKNALGIFHQPLACLIDRNEIDKLSRYPYQKEYGLSEMIKIGLIEDEELFRAVEENFEALISGEQKTL